MRSILILSCIALLVLCDVPNHCLKNQIVGRWRVHTSNPQPHKSQHEVHCGHDEPDNPQTSWRAFRESFKHDNIGEIELKQDYTIQIEKDGQLLTIGQWILIYDTGFELRINDGTRLFSFFDYYPRSGVGQYFTNCSATLVGWYKYETSRGCFRAHKINRNSDNDEINQVHIPTSPEDTTKVNTGGFLESTLKLTKDFSEIHELVSRINSIPDNGWQASNYEEYQGKTLEEIYNIRGNSRAKVPLSQMKKVPKNSYVGDLPESLDWSNVTGKAKNQGGCGSCYIFASTNMIEARLKILYDEDVLISQQNANDCSFYNQGCEGGQPFLVGKHGFEFEFVPASCHPYTARTGKCSASCDIKKLPKIYKTKEYYYVGGNNGFTDERSLMVELLENGPVAVSFYVNTQFQFYRGGIFSTNTQEELAAVGIDEREWRELNHAVLLVGWGQENGVKFWKCQNSWGAGWGERGYFRIKRGTNELAIENQGEGIIPYIVNQAQSE